MTAPALPARSATLADPLQFVPSVSSDVTGYVVHVGASSGFFQAGAGTSIDVGSSWQLVNGVGEIPLASLVTGSAYVVMQAYDADGLFSPASNEVYVPIVAQPAPDACATDLDCADGDACNGAERCLSGACTAGTALVCADPGPCRVGWCDAAAGCTSSPVADGQVCDDGNATTVGDSCQAGSCVGYVPPPDPTPDPAPGGGDGVLLVDDFEDVPLRAMPSDWIVTAADGSIAGDQYEVVDAGDGGRALGQPSTVWSPYLAHYVGGASDTWSSYEYIGRMRLDDVRGGIGATIVSSHPGTNAYVALLRDRVNPSFHLAVVPDDSPLICQAGSDTGVVPDAGAWMIFRLRAVPEANGLRIQAKIWDELDLEPAGWPVDCLAEGRAAIAGRPGVFATGRGAKLFDDLGAWTVTASDGSSETTVPLYADDFEDEPTGGDPDGWTDMSTGAVPQPVDAAFAVTSVPGDGRAIWTNHPGAGLTSFVDVVGAPSWTDYEVTGRMASPSMQTQYGVLIYDNLHAGGGAIGLVYTEPKSGFEVQLLGPSGGLCEGDPTADAKPKPSQWQRFRLRAVTQGDASVRVLARVWPDGESEPTIWTVDCTMPPGVAPTTGTFGLWSNGYYAKFWDDFVVRPVGGP